MRRILKFTHPLLIVLILFNVQLNATSDKNCKKSRTKKTMIAGAHCLRVAYFVSCGYHLIAAYMSAKNNLNDEKSSVSGLLKKIALGFFVELGGAYSSAYSFMGLSRYINNAKNVKVHAQDMSDIPAQFNQEQEEDIDKALMEMLFHTWIVLSNMRLFYLSAYGCAFPYLDTLKPHKPDYWERKKEFPLGLAPEDFNTIVSAPVLIPARLYTAYNSIKAISSKIQSLVASYKRELPKIYLSNSNGSK